MLIQISTPGGNIAESGKILSLLDHSLREHALSSTNTVANTIFPASMWNPDRPRQELYERYKAVWPQIKTRRANHYGVYFQRLIGFPDFGPDEKNQLEYIIATYHRGNHRHSAHQASIFHPPKDDTDQRQRGFPCLQQVSFSINREKLTVIGMYPTQHIFEKAYGNYLGLCRLGEFMAHEVGVSLAGICCFVNHPKVGAKGKMALKRLGAETKEIADSHMTEDE